MAKINNDLLISMENLKDLVWKVNMLFSSKREAVLACQAYSDAIHSWIRKINELRISRKVAKESVTSFRLAGYKNSCIAYWILLIQVN